LVEDQRTLGAKSPDNEKIVAMTATLNALKGQLKLDPKLSTIANEGKKKGDNKDKKKKNKKNTYNQKSCQRTVKSARKKWANTLTTGVSTTWRGQYTSLPTAY
jgi:hypothetical protein